MFCKFMGTGTLCMQYVYLRYKTQLTEDQFVFWTSIGFKVCTIFFSEKYENCVSNFHTQFRSIRWVECKNQTRLAFSKHAWIHHLLFYNRTNFNKIINLFQKWSKLLSQYFTSCSWAYDISSGHRKLQTNVIVDLFAEKIMLTSR